MPTLKRDSTRALLVLDAMTACAERIHAVTDVTCFSLLGHAREMALCDPAHGIEQVSFEIDHKAFAYFPGAVEAAREGHLSGGLKNNRAFIGDCVAFDASVPPEFQDLLFDPQTSGGLLIAISPESAEAALSALQHQDRKSTRLNSSHRCISYAVFCLKKKNTKT